MFEISNVASTLGTKSTRAVIEALNAGLRNAQALADLAIDKIRAKRAALIEALNGRFEDHHDELARIELAPVRRTRECGVRRRGVARVSCGPGAGSALDLSACV